MHHRLKGQVEDSEKVVAGAALGIAAVIALIATTGSLAFTWPWDVLPEFTAVEVELKLPTEARIVNVEPIMSRAAAPGSMPKCR